MPTYELPGPVENLFAYQVTIAAGASVSDGFPANGRELVGIVIPGTWTVGQIGFQGSLDGKTWYDAITDSAGVLVQALADAGADVGMLQVKQLLFRPFLRLLSVDGAGAAVNQVAATDIILLFRRYAGGS